MTKFQEKFIIDNFNNMTIRDMSKSLDLSYYQTKYICNKLGLKKHKYHYWNNDKINKLKKLVNTKSNIELAKIFNTNTNALSSIMTLYNIKRDFSFSRKLFGANYLIFDNDKNGCLICKNGYFNRNGIPVVSYKNKRIRVSKYNWILNNGEFDNQEFFLKNICGNNKCCNYNHYILKKYKRNYDKNRKRLNYSNDLSKWGNRIYKKFNYTCQKCGQYDGKLRAHHIKSFNDNYDLAFDDNNGICLCEKCHVLFHKTYGYGNNNEIQLSSFLEKSL